MDNTSEILLFGKVQELKQKQKKQQQPVQADQKSTNSGKKSTGNVDSSEQESHQYVPISVGLWDTAGGEDYPRLRPLVYPQTSCFFLCIDIMRPMSYLEKFTEELIKEIRHHCPGTPYILVGCKKDLLSNYEHILTYQNRQQYYFGQQQHKNAPLTKQQGKLVAKKLQCACYVEISALSSSQEDALDIDELIELGVALHMMPSTAEKFNSYVVSALQGYSGGSKKSQQQKQSCSVQ